MEDPQVENVSEEDFVYIAELAEECSPMATERNSIYHIFSKFFQNTSFVVRNSKKKEILGFLLGFISQKNPEEAYIHLLCVNPQNRGEGVAKAMIKKFLNVVIDKGCKRVSLITKPENKVSIEFYKKLGFNVDNSRNTIEINGIKAIKDYNGFGEHMVVFYKLI